MHLWVVMTAKLAAKYSWDVTSTDILKIIQKKKKYCRNLLMYSSSSLMSICVNKHCC